MIQEATGSALRFVIAGSLNRDFILPISGEPRLDALGGDLVYAATGLRLWGETAGLLARVGKNFPFEWLSPLRDQGFDLSGIRTLTGELEHRRFLAHSDLSSTHTLDPVQQFASRGLPFPPGLLGYQSPKKTHCSRTMPMQHSLQISDVPEEYLEASAVHLCPIDYVSHLMLPSLFRQGQATTITLTPCPGYMDPSFWEEIPGLLSEVTAFITSEAELRNLFRGRQTGLWEMATILGNFGPEYILIRTEEWAFYLYDRVSKNRWIVPLYQTRIVDPTGALDAFAGGFLAGYRQTYDPLEGALVGSIAASLVMEGSDPFYALNAMPELIHLRLNALRDLLVMLPG